MSWLGLDIGGANLKAADGRGWARTVPFALWRNPSGLADAVGNLVHQAPPADNLAVTMTGELCDCFRTKADGVRHILSDVEQAAAQSKVCVYLVDGRFVSAAQAREAPQLAAASNWHALARFACRYAKDRTGLVVDIGSTTTDLVPLVDGRPWTTARTDTERLIRGELIYSGVGRTPLCAVSRALPWRGQMCPLAAELFATTADAYVLLDHVPAQPYADWTADGRPLTKEFAHERIARMVCADTTTFSHEDANRAAEDVREAQVGQLLTAIASVCSTLPQPPEVWVISGSGEFLARLAAASAALPVVSLAAEMGPEISSTAAAHAVARLALETLKI
jgi:(4-(4-[2-(gamma-L-glutamylamino)ethyl]phenoxymethyl)furan-2-yl)methanamine synthase